VRNKLHEIAHLYDSDKMEISDDNHVFLRMYYKRGILKLEFTMNDNSIKSVKIKCHSYVESLVKDIYFKICKFFKRL